MEELSSNKRVRSEDSEDLPNSPEEKRLRSDLLLGIFDDDTDAGSEDGLASVMKSLEEEIGLPSPLDPLTSEITLDSGDAQQTDLGYLLEASDDELGLPPTVASSSEGVRDLKDSVGVDTEFGHIWGFTDELPDSYGFEYSVFRPESESVAGEFVGALDGELFGYSDDAYLLSDRAELSWRPESLPAV